MNRRKFIHTGAAVLAGASAILSPIPLYASGLNRTINVGLIGAGVRGRQLMRTISRHISTFKIIAVCDIMEDSLNAGLQLATPGATGYRDYKKLLEQKNIDAVFIATPLYLHFAMVADTLAAGKHVYCEKTMAYNIEQTLKMKQLVSASALIFQVGYQERSNPLFRQIARLISNDSCGTLTYIDCQWNRNGSWRKPVENINQEKHINWRMYRAFSGGLMAELCSHQIDLVNWITQKIPRSVVGTGGIDYWKDGRETFDNVSAIFNYDGGIKARFTALTSNAREGFSMKFYGTKATIEVNRKKGLQGFIYPEEQGYDPEDNAVVIDAITRPSSPWDSGANEIPILVDDVKSQYDATANALAEFSASITENIRPASNEHTAAIASIAVHMANEAMTTSKSVQWKDEYTEL